jgi:alpha-beta hydrolase superfamily lysophospholipase
MALDPFARAFCEAGIAVLVYDHRNLGASDGTPRQEINIWAQARDYRYAISWMVKQPEVCSDRIAIWGSSFSGGEVIAVAACDRRVKAVIANVPFATLPDVDYENAPDKFPAIRRNLLDESGNGLADNPGDVMGPLAVVEEAGNELPVFLPDNEAATWFLRLGKLPESGWENRVTIRNSFGTDPAFDPGVCIQHVSPTPLLMVVATQDALADTAGALAAFARAGEPKRLTMIEGGHFVTYQGRGFELAVSAMREFLLEYL